MGPQHVLIWEHILGEANASFHFASLLNRSHLIKSVLVEVNSFL